MALPHFFREFGRSVEIRGWIAVFFLKFAEA